MQPFLVPLSSESEREYLKKCKAGDNKARCALIEHNMRLVAHIAKKYVGTMVDQEDLMVVGTIGLCKAVDSFSVDKGSRLATYAARCIENEMLMLLRQERKNQREVSLFEPIGKDKDGNDMTWIDLLETREASAEEQLWQKQNLADLPKWMEEVLNAEERQLLFLRYGLDGQTSKTQREVGDLFGISRSYVSRLEKKAIGKLRKKVNVTI